AADGLGKRSSAYEYRIAGRGGKGITAIDVARGNKNTHVVASFPVVVTDQIVMVSNGGQIIRCPVDQISVVGRASRGVTLFKTAADEQVVSVSRLRDVNGGDDEGGEEPADEAGEAGDGMSDDVAEAAQASADDAGDETAPGDEGEST
ncbi:MAG: hypothetical protein HYZ04_05870, partial [Rhodospirillales bacterium]|nr:hypothetical protein [Rhodospirillales bacterium]